MLQASRAEEPEVEVRFEDQQHINEFGRLNTRLHELREDQKQLKDQLEKLDDATTELMVGEGGCVRLHLGETFVEVSEEYATEYCEKKQELIAVQVEQLSKEEATILARQAELKKILYGRFGSNINLEEK